MQQDTVRRCQRCRAPAVIVVNRWESQLLSGLVSTGRAARVDLRCQSCGASFSLVPFLLLRFAVGSFVGIQLTLTGVLSVVAAPIALWTQGLLESLVLVVLGIGVLSIGLTVALNLAGPQIRAWRNPLVPGAQLPELRLGLPEDHRACSCGQPAPCVRMTAHTASGLPTGTDSTYVCEACGSRFEVPDAWAVAFRVGAMVFLGTNGVFLASLLPFASLSFSNIACLAVLGLGTLGAGLLAASGVYRRLRHPRS